MLASRVALVTVALVLTLSAVSKADFPFSRVHKPCHCSDRAKKVCGKNGRNYNECYARCNGVPYACEGECPCSGPALPPTKPVVPPRSPFSCTQQGGRCSTFSQCCSCKNGAAVKCWGRKCTCDLPRFTSKAPTKSKGKKGKKSKDKKSKKGKKSKDKKSKKGKKSKDKKSKKGKKSKKSKGKKGKKSKGKGGRHRY